ncbi:unnamed protein product, partial [Rangifer tarandus platyrhynchus]
LGPGDRSEQGRPHIHGTTAALQPHPHSALGQEAGVAPPVSSRRPASRSACHQSTSASSGARLRGLGLEGVWTRSA